MKSFRSLGAVGKNTVFTFSAIFVDFLVVLLIRQFDSLQSKLFEEILFVSSLQCIAVFVIWFFKRFRPSLKKLTTNWIACGLIAALVFYNLASFTLINIDRSRSFYILGWVSKAEVKIVKGKLALNDVESHEAINPKAMQQRIDENIARGFIVKTETGYTLTRGGRALHSFSNSLAKLYNLQGWFDNRV